MNQRTVQSAMPHRQKKPASHAHRVIPFLAAFLLFSGCASLVRLAPPGPGDAVVNGIRVETRGNSTFLFHENRWELTWSGLSGRANVSDSDGRNYEKDTTLSYADITSASASGRGSTMTQFLLTLLGIVLVIGLAALILYAAFAATDR